jgi:AbrB family looped-hinge helix DNA binding protein
MPSRVVRVSKKNTIYIPKEIAEKVGISEGTLIEMSLENERIVLKPIPDQLWLALYGPKFAEVSIEDVERTSEEMQEEHVNEHESAP